MPSSFTFNRTTHSQTLPSTTSHGSAHCARAGTAAARTAAAINRELEEKGNSEKRSEIIFTAAICIVNDALIYSKKPSEFDGIKGLNKV